MSQENDPLLGPAAARARSFNDLTETLHALRALENAQREILAYSRPGSLIPGAVAVEMANVRQALSIALARLNALRPSASANAMMCREGRAAGQHTPEV